MAQINKPAKPAVDPSELIVVLPEFSPADAELSSAELESVAGGVLDTACPGSGSSVIICTPGTCKDTRGLD